MIFSKKFLNVKQYFKTLVHRKGSSNQVSVNVTFVHKKSQTFDELDAKLTDDLSEVSFFLKKVLESQVVFQETCAEVDLNSN